MLTNKSKRICMWGVPRSGSTYVFFNLVEHVIQQGWENFNTEFNRSRMGSEPFRKDVKQKLQEFKDQEYWLAKVHSIDIRNLKELNLYNDFANLPDYNILLLRKDIFQAALSLCVASIKQQWTNDHDDLPIEISEEKFIEMYTHQVNYKNMYTNMHFDQVIYTEDLTEDPNDIWSVLTGQYPDNPITNTIEKSPDKTKVVTNYQQLKDLYNEMCSS